MIKIEKTEVYGWEAAIRGMRNPHESWDNIDSWGTTSDRLFSDISETEEVVYQWKGTENTEYCLVGPNDLTLMKKLCKAGSDHRKFMRMIICYMDITAPLYWWKEYDTYKIGTVANSCSTMHGIEKHKFTMEDFSCEHLISMEMALDMNNYPWVRDNELVVYSNVDIDVYPKELLELTIDMLNNCRALFLETKDKKYWWQMIQLLPSSYNQKRTCMVSYEMLLSAYRARKGHKQDEWSETFCQWVETLPYSELITGKDLNYDTH